MRELTADDIPTILEIAKLDAMLTPEDADEIWRQALKHVATLEARHAAHRLDAKRPRSDSAQVAQRQNAR